MARLETDIIPVLDKNIKAKLHSHNIYTVYDFMLLSSDDLMKKINLSFKEIEKVREAIFKNFGGKLQNLLDLYQRELNDVISTGIKTLDDMLEGGLHCGRIYEICGYSSAGKSQLCHWISKHATLNSSSEVHYIDTSDNFCVSRIQMILETRRRTDRDVAKVMSNIKVYKAVKVADIFTVLHHLSNASKDQVEQRKKIVIVDSLSVLFGIVSSNDFNSILSNFTSICRFFVSNCRGVVITVNTVRVEGGRTLNDADKDVVVSTKPALTNYWLGIPNVRLLITNLENSQKKIAVWKSFQLEHEKSCLISIKDEGIFSV